MKTTVNKRVFLHNGTRLQDPDVSMSPASVKDLFSTMYPELLNAEIKGPEIVGNDITFTFHRTTGTKASASVPTSRRAKKGLSKSSFVRRLESAAAGTHKPSNSLSITGLKNLNAALTPARGSQAATLDSASLPLLL